MANTKISALTANTNPTGNEEFVYAYNNANGKITLDTMKTFVGGAGVTTLNADANIWELNEGTYVTTYDLYYKSGSKVITLTGAGTTKKQMIFIVKEATGEKSYLVFNVGHINSNIYSYAGFGYSVSSSVGKFYELRDKKWALEQYEPYGMSSINSFDDNPITQIINNASGTEELSIDNSITPYPGLTYTVYVESASDAYTVTLGNGVSNPFGITLPSHTTKKCLITVLITSTTSGIVTGCTIEP